MSFEFKPINFDLIKKELVSETTKAFARALSDEVAIIKSRTRSGLDVNNQGFVGYADSTKSKKSDAGKQISPVNLTETGTMLRTMTYTITEISRGFLGIIFFPSAEEAKKAEYNNALRRFFALSNEQISRIVKATSNVIRK